MIPLFRNPQFIPRQGTAGGEWSLESYDDAFSRTPRFGQAFFTRLLAAHPELRDDLRFLRQSAQSDDVYAVFDRAERGFAVVLDAALEYIVVIGEIGTVSGAAEFGDWGTGNDQVQDAIDHIRAAYLKKPE